MLASRTIVGLSISVVALSACTRSAQTTTQGSPSPQSPAASPTISLTTTPSGTGALISSLPSGCAEGAPAPAATVAFVSSGRAWAAAPDGTGLTCLFDVVAPGPFAWGPQGDRVLLDGLEVRGVGSSAQRPAGTAVPTAFSWGRPVGKAIVFSQAAQLEKAAIGSGQIDDISPFPATAYRDVAYHPSGLAIGFVVVDAKYNEGEGEPGYSIWMSSNTGADQRRLVWSKTGTEFGPIAFEKGGDQLFYVAHQPSGKWFLARLLLKEGKVSEGQWIGDAPVLRLSLAPSPTTTPLTAGLPAGAALDVGTGCDDRRAVSSTLDGSEGKPLLPAATRPTTALGWLDPSNILVAEGGCDGPFDLWVANVAEGAPVLLAGHVDVGAVRTIASGEAPPLPDLGIQTEFA